MSTKSTAPTAVPGSPRLQLAETIMAAFREAEIDCVISVPEYNFVDLLESVDRDSAIRHVPVTREEEGVGVAVGSYLGGLRPVIVMQNAGLLNSCNAITTTALQFEVPVFMLVWYAGDVGDTAFMRLGEVTEHVLAGLGVRYLLPRSLQELGPAIVRGKQLADYAKRPVAVLVTRY